MTYLVGAVLLVMTLILTWAGLRALRNALKFGWNWRLPVALACCVLFFYGIGGFLGPMLSVMGALDWAGSFEWPVGYATGVARAPDGSCVVPHGPSDRIQIYDRNLRFVRGWRIEAHGGPFTIRMRPDGLFDVYTARRRHHFVYDQTGKLHSESTFAEIHLLNRPPEAISMFVPTRWWLWPLSHPFLGFACWLVLVPIGWLLDRNKPPHIVEEERRLKERAQRLRASRLWQVAKAVSSRIAAVGSMLIGFVWFGSTTAMLVATITGVKPFNPCVVVVFWLIGLGLLLISVPILREFIGEVATAVSKVRRPGR